VSPASLPAVTGDAVRLMEAGSQAVDGFVIIKVGVPPVIVIVVLVAVVGFAQGSLLVIFTDRASPLARVDVVKVEAVCPATFTPLIIH